jgi:hypothetical protein
LTTEFLQRNKVARPGIPGTPESPAVRGERGIRGVGTQRGEFDCSPRAARRVMRFPPESDGAVHKQLCGVPLARVVGFKLSTCREEAACHHIAHVQLAFPDCNSWPWVCTLRPGPAQLHR